MLINASRIAFKQSDTSFLLSYSDYYNNLVISASILLEDCTIIKVINLRLFKVHLRSLGNLEDSASIISWNCASADSGLEILSSSAV